MAVTGLTGILANAVIALKQALEARDEYTMTHSKRVRTLALAMGKRLRLSRRLLRDLGLAAELHDVGKIGVSDDLLHKPGSLTRDEHLQVLEHAVIGEAILRPLFGDRPRILQVVRSHHERVDGTGYPDALEGENIPLLARILAVADAFDAMTSRRPYRDALPRTVAIAELVRCQGTQFEEHCVSALVWVLQSRARDGMARSGVLLIVPQVSNSVARGFTIAGYTQLLSWDIARPPPVAWHCPR